MGAKIVQDAHYTRDNRNREVFTLIVQKDDISSFGRSYTIPELTDIAETIIKFLERRKQTNEQSTIQVLPDIEA